MARTWKHYDCESGGYVEWEAGTDPGPSSIFRPKFLNQFVMWIRYLNQCGGSETSDPDWVAEGDNVQSAEFWNGLVWIPSAKWLENLPEEGTDFEDYAAKLVDSDLFTGDQPEIKVGDIIEPMAAENVIIPFVKALRQRLDASIAWVLDSADPAEPSGDSPLSQPFSGITADTRNQKARRDTDPPTWGSTIDESAAGMAIDYYSGTAGIAPPWDYLVGNRYTTNTMITSPNESVDLEATVHVGVHSGTGASGSPLPEEGADGTASFPESHTIGTEAVSASNFGYVTGFPVDKAPPFLCFQYLFPIYCPADEPPETFYPPDGLL